MNKIYRRKNTITEDAELDMEIQQTEQEDALEEEFDEVSDVGLSEVSGEMGEKVQQIEALVARNSDLLHYRAFDDIDFIIEAIGKKDYSGSPALDVLPSHDGIDRERREKTKDYIQCLSSWAEGKEVEDAVAEFKASEKLLRSTYAQLGVLDEDKKQLALFLAENLGEKVASPEDAILEVSDEEFINYVYNAILGRGPDDDDFNLRLMELRRGKTRQELITEILESRESSRRMVSEIAKSIKTSNGS